MFSDKENVLVLIPEWRCEENEHIENLKTPKEHQERANPFYPQRKTAPSQVGTQFVEWQLLMQLSDIITELVTSMPAAIIRAVVPKQKIM